MRDQGLALWSVTEQSGALSYRAASRMSSAALPSPLIRRSSSFSPGRAAPRVNTMTPVDPIALFQTADTFGLCGLIPSAGCCFLFVVVMLMTFFLSDSPKGVY